jgi:Ca2+-transporting ATPase
MGEIMILFVAMIAGLPLPLTALQLLVLNLVTDGAPALALGLEKGEPGIMKRQPRPVDEPIINGPMIWGTAVQTIAIASATLGAFGIGLALEGMGQEGVQSAETMAFLTLTLSELLRAYTARSEQYPLFSIGVFSNKAMQWAVLASAAVVFAIVYVPGLNSIFGVRPPTWEEWLVVIPFTFLPAVVAELQKVIRLNRDRKRGLA